jgi:hypothetical protein
MGRFEGTSLFGLIMILFLIPGFLCGGIWCLLNPVTFWQAALTFIVCVVMYFVFLAIEIVLLLVFGN